MAVNGLRKFSLIDYPGKLCCVVFFGNCNFRCPYCHNPVLIFDPESQGRMSLTELTDFFQSRQGKLDAAVFSGGEPTLQPDLDAYLRSARDSGFLTKLDTNGTRPDLLESFRKQGILDALGIDFKAPFARYGEICKNSDPDIPGRVRRSLEFAVRNAVELDVRTTVHRALLGEEDLRTMYGELAHLGVTRWVLQQFHHAELIDESLNDRPTWTDRELRDLAASLGPMTKVRGAG